MKKHYSTRLFLSFILLAGAIGCHQEPIIPKSAIPGTCQIYRIAVVNEGIRDTTTYIYNGFGHVEEVTYRQWTNGIMTTNSRQNFTYSADHYLVSQVDQTTAYTAGGSSTRDSKGYIYTYQDGLIQQVAIGNALSGQTLGYTKYTYENGKLKTYVETNAQQQPVRSYTFDGTGKLVQVNEAGTTTAVVTNGKITKRILNNGTTIAYQFDNKGQLVSDSTALAGSQIMRTYSYDNYPYWNKTQLQFRGIPSPDLGGHTFVHNLIANTIVQTQNGRFVQNQKFEYRRTYTKTGYTLGYARSDGARQNIVYTNCI
ncbi:hypothetical protein HNV11_16075 [Spirosoma taeanense]|uniref:YD repeat-containing protein n=1 Tax=Spirosoma taeanense TaxID=2735870 RepID=A0A6M5Y946_9BACT|nr:hypothetical protein [Spirosoma taeanense]QJW90787.1 hypothetical protein HNV11_16075 [Spirosoma taeanense]